MGIGDELAVVGQVTRGVAGQGPVDESRNLEQDALPHMKPVQLAEHRRDMITSSGARHEPGGSVLNWLQAAHQFVGDAVAQGVAVVQATDNKDLDHRLRCVLWMIFGKCLSWDNKQSIVTRDIAW